MDWQWDKFLGRAGAPIDVASARAAVEGRRVMITGAGGSIGSSLAQAVLEGSPVSLVLVDNSEYALYEVYRKLRGRLPSRFQSVAIAPLLGDIGEPGFIRMALRQHRPDLVFHAAAFKHVHLLGENILAAMGDGLDGERFR